jgi:hypothetical protein
VALAATVEALYDKAGALPATPKQEDGDPAKQDAPSPLLVCIVQGR